MDMEYNYQQGLYHYENRNYEEAKHYFTLTKESLEYHKESLNYLVLIEICNTNYREARKLLEEYQDELYFENALTYATLEKAEFNVQKGLNIVLDSFQDPNFTNKKLLLLADFYLELGEYGITRKILETVRLSSDYYKEATLKLIYLDIIEEDYLDALNLFKGVENLILNPEQYNKIKALIAYKRGVIKDLKRELNTSIYYVKRLVSDDENVLLNHINSRHIISHEDENESLFFNNLDINKVIKTVRKNIKVLNPSINKKVFVYHVIFPKPIGYSNGRESNSIKVLTALKTNKILTMYPAILSDEFNKEGLMESKELKLKRGLKWKN